MKRLPLLLLFLLLASFQGYAQSRTVSGTVVDATTSEPLVGAAIVAAGTQKGTTSIAGGLFELDIPKDTKSILVKYIGYSDITVPVKDNMRIEMTSDAKDIDEVVVVGYGMMKKSDLTGSIGSIKSGDLLKSNPISAEKGMQGRLAGVNVVQNDGAPGSGITVQIRGSNTFMGSTDPLFVIDGVPMTTNNGQETINFEQGNSVFSRNALSFLDPKDIESMEVLKDASSTAIYGSRGANGVILITTKSGAAGKDRITLSYNVNIAEASSKIRMLSSREYAEYRNLADVNTAIINGANLLPQNVSYPGITYRNEDGTTWRKKGPSDFFDDDAYYWQDRVLRTAVSHDLNLNISGSFKGTDYAISGGYLNQEGIVINSDYKRYNFKVTLNRDVKPWLKIGTSTNFSTSTSNMIKAATNNRNNGDEGVIRSALYYPPTYKEGDEEVENGEYTLVTDPVAYTKALNTNKNTNIYTSNYANITLCEGLVFRTVLGFNTSINQANSYYPRSLYEGKLTNGQGYAGDNNWNSLVYDNLLMFNRDFGKHNINTTLGISWESSTWYNKAVATQGYGNDITEGWLMGDAAKINYARSDKGDSKLFSVIFRAAYNYDNRYYITVTARRDASSKFIKGNRASFFPSAGVSYRLSQEKFMQPLKKVVSNLKLRYSYGLSGNQAINSYQTYSLMVSSNYPFGEQVINGFAPDPANPGNKELKWETTYQHDVGIDLSLFNRVNITLDLYSKTTEDLLQRKDVSTSTGIASYLTNLGTVSNRGLELSVDAQVIDRGDLRWSLAGNISFNRNKVTDIGEKPMFPNKLWSSHRPFVIQNGYPIGQLYGFVEEGIWSSRDQVITSAEFQETYPGYSISDNNAATEAIIKQKWVGEIRYKNIDDSDNVINDNDQTYIGNVNPKFFYGVSTNFSWKSLEFSMLWQGVYGNDIINEPLMRQYDMGQTRNRPARLINEAWTPTNGGTAPKIYTTSSRTERFSRRYIEDGSYIKLRNITIGYNWSKPVKWIGNIKFYASGNNLLTFTKYNGYDPEVNVFGSDPSSRGIDAGGYPQSRSFTIGVILTF